MRRINGFSKRIEAHVAMLSLYLLHYNFCRLHQTLRCSPTMAVGVDDQSFSAWTNSRRCWSRPKRTGGTDDSTSMLPRP